MVMLGARILGRCWDLCMQGNVADAGGNGFGKMLGFGDAGQGR